MEGHFVAAVISAVIAGVVAIGVAFLGARMTVKRMGMDQKIATQRATVDKGLATLKAEFDRELAEQKARLDNRAVYAAERVAHQLLMHENWKLRSFEAIRRRLDGFDDKELKRILVQAGAVRFAGPSGAELWGLIERNRDALDHASEP